MSASDSHPSANKLNAIRCDGWTVERQIGFLQTLARTRSATKAAASVAMSREGAYRLRARRDARLFSALWDRILQPDAVSPLEGHSSTFGDGLLARLLGMQYRRQNGDFPGTGSPGRAL
ncbi:MAG: hypothetical protein H0W39_10945 [Sphingomonas sp.]|nr:hypothetical protein [Sphingomonas sp.]